MLKALLVVSAIPILPVIRLGEGMPVLEELYTI